MNILEELAEAARKRVREAEQAVSLQEMRAQALSLPAGNYAFERALRKPGLSFICECKKASPSKGIIDPKFPYLSIATEYEAAGADAISVLTEPTRFLGKDEYLREIAAKVSIPCLRKDFIVDEYMIHEARVLGAGAVLLIVSLLSRETLEDYIALCDCLGLSALVEAHSGEEVKIALAAGARIIGVNNRNLKNFTVDQENSRRLRELVPPGVLFVSESGVKSEQDIQALAAIGADAVLIGETLMRASDRAGLLQRFRAAAESVPYVSLSSGVKVKLCGLRREADIAAANAVQPDFAGFVFAPASRRYVSPIQASYLREKLDPAIRAVGVFVDEGIPLIVTLCRDHTIQAVQLHGSESPEYVDRLREELRMMVPYVPIIQAFKIRSAQDAARANESRADLILLDAGAGAGVPFDWSLLTRIRRPYILAGGLSPKNAAAAMEFLSGKQRLPYGVDVSSGIETDGCKDPRKMEAFTRTVQHFKPRSVHHQASSST